MLDVGTDAGPPSSQTEGRGRGRSGTVAVVAGLGSLLFGVLAVTAGRPVVLVLFAVAALLVLGLACALAAYRFDLFVVLLLTVRPSLDRVPFKVGPLDVSSILALLFLVAGTLWLAARARRSPLTFTPMSVALIAFAGIAALSSLVAASPLSSAIAASKTLSGVLMFLVLERLLREHPERLRSLVTAVLASAVVPCLVALQQFATGTASGTISGGDLSRIPGTFVHPNPFATYLALVLVLGVAVLPHVRRRRDQVLVLAVVGLASVSLLLTYSRGGWLAALVGLAYLLGKRSVVLLLLAGIAVVTAAAFSPPVQARFADIGAPPPVEGVPANSLEWRVGYWQDVLPLASINPITGIGLEGVQTSTSAGLPPHNAYVQSYVETGVLGLAALLGVVVTGVVTLRRRLRNAAPGLERGLALAAVAMGLGLLAQTLTENLLTQTMALWYFAAAGTWGYVRRASGDDQLVLSFRSGRERPRNPLGEASSV